MHKGAGAFWEGWGALPPPLEIGDFQRLPQSICRAKKGYL